MTLRTILLQRLYERALWIEEGYKFLDIEHSINTDREHV